MRRHYGNYLKGLPNVEGGSASVVYGRHRTILEEILDEVIMTYQWPKWPEGIVCSGCRGTHEANRPMVSTAAATASRSVVITFTG